MLTQVSTSSARDGPPFYHHQRSVSREADEMSSHAGGSRETSPSGSEHGSSSSDNDGSKVSLPSIRDFCRGRLPSMDSTLDERIRGLGIEQPLPPLRSIAPPKPPVLRSEREDWPMAASDRSPPSQPYHSPYQYSPSLPQRSISHSSREASPYYQHNDDDSSMDSDSDDSCSSLQQEAYRRTCVLRSRNPPVYYRSRSFGSSDNGYGSPTMGTRGISPVQRLRPAFPPPNAVTPYDRNGPREHQESENGLSNLNWEDYVEKAGRLHGSGPVMFTCRWKKDNGQPCKYTGKKQLAKRHVESVHLAKKPHICPTCSKPFPQKTSLDIHIRSVHTFERTVKCEHCDVSFSDPARRHKHVKLVHPEKVVKKTRNKLDYDQIQHFLVK